MTLWINKLAYEETFCAIRFVYAVLLYVQL